MLSCAINFQISVLFTYKCKLKEDFVFALVKLIINFFYAVPTLSLILFVDHSPNYKLRHFYQSHYQNYMNLLHPQPL